MIGTKESNKNLAIIGASYLQLPLIQKAKEMGYITHVFAWAANDVGEREADYFYPISIVDKEKICEKCREINIIGICSIASDLAVITVNYVAKKLHLPGNSWSSTIKSTNKYKMRQAFLEGGDPSPKCVLVKDAKKIPNLSDFKYPLIVKPTDRSGSRGITKIESSKELHNAILNAIEESFEKKALIEEYVEGREYSVEAISYNGIHTVLAITLKFTTGSPHFIEQGHLQPAPLDEETYGRVCKIVKHALNTLEIENGASHSEIKIDDNGNIKIIEIGARMGGDCIGSDLVIHSTGIDYVKNVILVACGEKTDFAKVLEPHAIEVKYLFSEDDVKEMKKIEKTSDFIRCVAFFPENLGTATDSSNRAGCYLVKHNEKNE